jgi:hypothetical protein
MNIDNELKNKINRLYSRLEKTLCENIENSRELSVAITNLQTSNLWAINAIEKGKGKGLINSEKL